jgi:hypothetical protein
MLAFKARHKELQVNPIPVLVVRAGCEIKDHIEEFIVCFFIGLGTSTSEVKDTHDPCIAFLDGSFEVFRQFTAKTQAVGFESKTMNLGTFKSSIKHPFVAHAGGISAEQRELKSQLLRWEDFFSTAGDRYLLQIGVSSGGQKLDVWEHMVQRQAYLVEEFLRATYLLQSADREYEAIHGGIVRFPRLAADLLIDLR